MRYTDLLAKSASVTVHGEGVGGNEELTGTLPNVALRMKSRLALQPSGKYTVSGGLLKYREDGTPVLVPPEYTDKELTELLANDSPVADAVVSFVRSVGLRLGQ